MQKKQITVTIDNDGKVTVQVKGVKGKECVSLTDDLIKALGDVVKQTKTPDYYQQAVVAAPKVRLK